MEKALVLSLFVISYGIVSGQFCSDLPPESTIAVDFAEQLGSFIPQSSDRELYYNCIAYDGASRNHIETTVTVRYVTGSSIFSAQARYVCGETDSGTGVYEWAVGNVMRDTGTTETRSGCANCEATSEPTTCAPCDPNVCQNGSPDVFCVGCGMCESGYTGADCSMDIDECSSAQPCEGGANCTNTIGSFTCTCPDACIGECNACCSSPCTRGGNCSSNNSDTFTCTCPPGWSGQTCTVFLGGCFSDPCMNGGECVDVFDVENPLAYRCSCPMGFTGVDCESRIDYCVSRPCRHSGWCTSLTTGYTCSCLQGYTGRDCGQPLQTCLSNPAVCGSNGICSSRTVDNIPTSYCSCNPGYMGVFCEQQITSCIDDYAPCLHQGTCNNQTTGNISFSCNCTVGNWAGFYCTDCGLPCINGNLNGICTECKCYNDDWIGNSCDEIRNCTSYDNITGNCLSCEGDLIVMNNSCIARTNPPDDDNTAETVGIILGCVAGAGIILIVVFVLLFVALRYVQISGMASMRKDDPALLDKQQARLSGFFAPKSTLFSSGGHTGGIRTGVDSSFPSYKEMVNEEVNPPAEDDATYKNVSPAARSDLEHPEYEDINPDDEWLPPPDDD